MDDFLAVVVLYKTQISKCGTLISINADLAKSGTKLDLVIYDNSPDYNQSVVSDFKNFNVTYVADPENSGVSIAYNYGYSIASAKVKKWILLLDQDTVFPESSLQAYLRAIQRYPAELLFAPVMLTNDNKIISPGKFKWMRGSYAKDVMFGINKFKGHSLINSGLCIELGAYLKNGGYNEKIKLDYSDHDFIHRFSKNISETYVVVELKLVHQLSTHVKNTFNSDKVRFDYYLEGARHFSAGKLNTVFLRIVTLLRSTKLSIAHRNVYFVKKYFNGLFS